MKNYYFRKHPASTNKNDIYEKLGEMIDATNSLLHFRPLFEVNDCPPWESDRRFIRLSQTTQITLRLSLEAAREALRLAQDEIAP